MTMVDRQFLSDCVGFTQVATVSSPAANNQGKQFNDWPCEEESHTLNSDLLLVNTELSVPWYINHQILPLASFVTICVHTKLTHIVYVCVPGILRSASRLGFCHTLSRSISCFWITLIDDQTTPQASSLSTTSIPLVPGRGSFSSTAPYSWCRWNSSYWLLEELCKKKK